MSAPVICANCGTQGPPRTETRGHILLEIGLWLLFIVPGVIYSLWRLTTRRRVCRTCGSPELVPLNTPRGRKLAADFTPK